MTISLYQASVPPCIQALTALKGVLAKGAEHAESRKIDPAIFLQARLFPNMFALTRQVQVATDLAKGGCCRLAGTVPPTFPDTEASFPDLQRRLDQTIDVLNGLRPADIDGAEGREIVLKVGGQEMRFLGQAYLLQFVLPNVYFHAAAAYTILRHNGVELAKRDFLGDLQTL